MNKTLLIIIILIAVIVVGGIWWWTKSKAPSPGPSTPSTPQTELQPPADSTAAINQSLNQVDLGDVDTDLQKLDSDINSL